MAYIKLGPRGRYFSSKLYNIHLVPGSATIANDQLIYGDLAKFIITGYLIVIGINEYENLKLNYSNNPKVNSVPKGVNTLEVVEPVKTIYNSPPFTVRFGDRYIVDTTPLSDWANYKDYIVEWNGLFWETLEPWDGLIVPLMDNGIAAIYQGTYPSGKWVINPKDERYYIDEIISGGGGNESEVPATNEELIARLEKEIQDRIDGDKYLKELIDQMGLDLTSPEAKDVRFDNRNIMIELGDNVQVAIEWLYASNKNNTESIELLKNRLELLENAITQLNNSLNSNLTKYYYFVGQTDITITHNLGYIPITSTYEPHDPPTAASANPNMGGIPFKEVIATAYEVTTSVVKYKLNKPANLLVVLTQKS